MRGILHFGAVPEGSQAGAEQKATKRTKGWKAAKCGLRLRGSLAWAVRPASWAPHAGGNRRQRSKQRRKIIGSRRRVGWWERRGWQGWWREWGAVERRGGGGASGWGRWSVASAIGEAASPVRSGWWRERTGIAGAGDEFDGYSISAPARGSG